MATRKIPLVNNEIYHIYTRSIADFKVFRSSMDCERMINVLCFYTVSKPPCKFSEFADSPKKVKDDKAKQINQSDKIVKILAYCLMPTHLHLVLKQSQDGGISKYTNLVLKSYSAYFNTKYDRLGPLWESRFKNVLVETDEQLLHLTRYVHLNPVSASLAENPLDWEYSSYREYLGLSAPEKSVCEFSSCLDIKPDSYKIFVNERIEYQRELEKIKHLTLE